MRSKLIAATAALAGLSMAAAPLLAQAQPHHHRHRVQVCTYAGRNAKNTGTVVGAVAGGLLGRSLAHGGGKTGGTLLGAGAGAVAGHQIAKHNGKKCHWEWRD
ncbi:glycine zipper 2TM domain-containing protein [Arthrobacter sp.]|uniref:glycine zipper 2TM domain-containing protein n=1 Tax=Arthrobacter sp. TaxID=1667 RepID=UPI00258E9C6B|nr:glycine zipper 2TM domain-containing protein [Arthrobacter sp.]